jgi:hypothetical protein
MVLEWMLVLLLVVVVVVIGINGTSTNTTTIAIASAIASAAMDIRRCRLFGRMVTLMVCRRFGSSFWLVLLLSVVLLLLLLLEIIWSIWNVHVGQRREMEEEEYCW